METPPALVDDIAEAVPQKQTGLGYTLQTLIVTAAIVVMAAVAAIVLWGVTRGSIDNTEEAGRIGAEARCSPNEVRNQDLESKGLKGTNRILNNEIAADAIGCYPVCGTWEYYDQGMKAAGTGGPQGNGGVYSSDIGCFAPCYWNHDFPERMWRPGPSEAASDRAWLSYYDDNRPPGINQIRLGVNYRRRPASEMDSPAVDEPLLAQASDIMITFMPIENGVLTPTPGRELTQTADRKPYMHTRIHSATGNSPFDPDPTAGGSRFYPGELPLHPKQIAAGLPTVFKPNWITRVPTPPVMDPGGTARNGTAWEDENWEYRADPYKEVCTIVNTAPTTPDDEVVCSSEWENCRRSYR